MSRACQSWEDVVSKGSLSGQQAVALQEKVDADFAVREGLYARLKGEPTDRAEAHAEATFEELRRSGASTEASGSSPSSHVAASRPHILQAPHRHRKDWRSSPHVTEVDWEEMNSSDSTVAKKAKNRVNQRQKSAKKKAAAQGQSAHGTTAKVTSGRLGARAPAAPSTSMLPPTSQGTHSTAVSHQPLTHSPSSSTDSVTNFAMFLYGSWRPRELKRLPLCLTDPLKVSDKDRMAEQSVGCWADMMSET